MNWRVLSKLGGGPSARRRALALKRRMPDLELWRNWKTQGLGYERLVKTGLQDLQDKQDLQSEAWRL